jgi:uncharacterized protein with NAD-binding domain and iron-sulfur cluster
LTKTATIVVGAGIAGLTAAYQLKKAGQDVLVLDMNNYVGGRMANVEWEGFLVDIGAKFVTTADKSLLKMVDELGLSDQMVESNEGLRITIYRDGKLHSANFLSIPSYFGWSGVSLKARLAMLKLLPHFLKVGKLGASITWSVRLSPIQTKPSSSSSKSISAQRCSSTGPSRCSRRCAPTPARTFRAKPSWR